MKKMLAWTFGMIFLLLAALLVAATVYFKPLVKEQIIAQLQKFGFDQASVGDIDVGLYSSSISDLALDQSGANKIAEISANYWPQQILNKKLNSITILNPKIDIVLKENGEIFVSGYRLPMGGANQGAENPLAAKTSATAPAAPMQKGVIPDDLPINHLVIKGADIKLKTPSQKLIAFTADAEIDLQSETVKGYIDLPPLAASVLQEVARQFKPDLANMVSQVSGTVGAQIAFDLASLSDFSIIPGKGIITMENVGLTYKDIRVDGLTSGLELKHLTPPTLPAGQIIAIDRIKKGAIELTNAHTEFGLDKMRNLDVKHASVEAAGGILSTSPFKLDLQNINTVVTLKIMHVKIASLAQLFNLSGFAANGEFEGTLPLYINQNGVSINQQDIVKSLGQNLDKFLPEKTKQKIDEKLKKLGTGGEIINNVIRGGNTQQPQPQQPTQQQPAQQQPQTAPQPQQQQQPVTPDKLLNDLLFGR